MAWECDATDARNEQRPQSYWKTVPKGRRPVDFVPDFKDSAIDFSMLTYPVAVETLKPFEEANKIHVFIFGWNEGEGVATRFYPHKAREHIEGYREVMLLLHKKHYCWVKNFQRLMCLRVDHGSRRYCHRCTSSFKTTTTSTGEEKLRVHLEQKCTSEEANNVGPPSLPED